MEYSPFVIIERPLCVYGEDLRKSALEFLDGVDAGYFEDVATRHANSFEGVDNSKPDRPIRERSDEERAVYYAAISVRLAYAQALETLFALLGALVQAPLCPAGWITKYQPQELRTFVQMLNTGSLTYWRTPEPPTWVHLARLCLPIKTEQGGAERVLRIQSAYARLWQRLRCPEPSI
jgi:hypothetical protein